MDIFKKQVHLVIIFMLIFSLLSPAATGKAQYLEGETYEQNTPEINNTELDNPNVQSAITPLIEDAEDAPYTISDIQLNTEGPLLLTVGDTSQLTATVTTTDDSAIVEWLSGEPTIAEVNDEGLVTAISIGAAKITAQIGEESKAIDVYVITPEAQEAIDFIIALPEIEKADEETYELLKQARELDGKVKAPARNILLNDLPYFSQLLEKEIEYFRHYMEDPINAIPAPEDITSLSDELNNKLDTVRERYTSLIKPSGYRKVTEPDILAFNQELVAKEVKYAILTIDALPKIEDLTIDPAIKEQLEHARKKYDVVSKASQSNVTNRQEVFDKQIRYVELLIDAIDVNDALAEEQLEVAKDALKKLSNPNNTTTSKGVSNYNDLLEKEKMINAAEDINQVIEKIDALPSVETIIWADHLKVLEAQQAYDKLLPSHKILITNYAKLEALQKRLVELQPLTVETYNAVADYLTSGSYEPTYGSEWTILTLARGDNPNKYSSYYEKYYRNLVSHVKATNGEIDKQATDWARVIIALTAIGKDPTNVAGYNLVDKLADFNFATSPGVNSTIYSLIALDTWAFELPETATTTRDKLIQNILSKEKNGGGFAWSGDEADPDMTAMVLQALAPYQSDSKVKAVTERALTKLAAIQSAHGGFASMGSENAESAAQVVTALASLGIDANKDERFNKVISNIMTYSSGDGGFKHVYSQQKADGMATVQVGYTLAAYNRLLNNQTALYDMSDTKSDNNGNNSGNGDVNVIQPSPDNKVDIPQDNKEYKILLDNLGDENALQVIIPEEKQAKTYIELPVNTSLPEIIVNKGDIFVEFVKGSTLISSNTAPIELITTKAHDDATLKNKINAIIDLNKEIAEIHSAFSMGGSEKVEFDQFVTITFRGMSGKDVAYIQANKIYPIEKFDNDQKGLASGKLEYTYDVGNDLIVKTKHFTDFIFYSKLSKETPDNGGVSPPGGGIGKNKITLSIDKFTINKGYVLPPTKVAFYDGENVWDVLKREMDNRGISYEYSYSDMYDSVYVESIAGDGEFDHGSGSGWMYNVNGWYPNYGATGYILQDGDVVQWRYTTDLGADLGEDLSKWEGSKDGPGISIPVNPGEKNPVVDIPSNIDKDYVLDITKDHKDLESITLNIPNANVKLSINLEEVRDDIPNIIVRKEDKLFVINKGTKLRSGRLTIDIFAEAKEKDVIALVKEGLANENIYILDAFSMGSSEGTIFFDKPVTLTFKGMKGQGVGFIEKDKWNAIQIFNSEQEGQQATKDLEMQTYAFVDGNDLIVKTNHFTTFVLYATKEVAVEEALSEEKKLMYADAKLISPWAYDLIHEATEKGFVEGFAGKINPKSNVTRAEFAKLMVSALGLDIKTDRASNFADVKPGDWFYPYVNAAYSEKIVEGFEAKFLPNDKITREEMAVMIVRALGIEDERSNVEIKDRNQVSSWAQSAVETIVSSNIMEGYDGKFTPRDLATREMSIVVAMRAYHYHDKGTNVDTNKDTIKDADTNEDKDADKDEDKDADKGTTNATNQETNRSVKKIINKTASFMQKTITDPIVASIGGEWTVFGLARSGESIPSAYYDKYYATVERTLKEKSGVLHSVKYTEYDRVILALTAIGKDVHNVAGYDLREPLADFNKVVVQGINGPIFALIALDSHNYEIPIVQGVEVQTTREKLVDFILSREIQGGGWALGQNPTEADPDITAMAIQGLTPYYKTNEKVKKAVDRGVSWLSKVQHDDGGYASWGSLNSESVAQVIVALTGLGIDPHTDPRFVKKGHSALDALVSFAAPNGGFYHIKAGGKGNGGAQPGEVDAMATDQAMYALIAYDRFINGKKRLYDMTGVLN